MKVVIAGAGKVGRSIARELQHNGHEVLMLDRDPIAAGSPINGVTITEADACEIRSLEEVGLESAQVVVAATGDDKVNLVLSLLSKTEFGVPRVVARVNHPKNEWLFDESWGVDVAVSTPRLLSALVEEAVTIGDLVRLFALREGTADLVEITLPADSPVVGSRVGDVNWPIDTALVAILRGQRVITPTADDPLEIGDELVFVAAPEQESTLAALLSV
jgi:trk system potassium uptake protein